MAVKKWSWKTANPAANQPSYAYVKYNATAAEVQKAYQALVTKGPTKDFSYKVWNDLCAKILDLNKAWQTNHYFGHTWPEVWILSPHVEDYPDEETFRYENNVAGGTYGQLRYYAMNMAVDALIPISKPPWSAELKRDNIKKGDVFKASYFLWMVQVINHWCDLVPIWLGWSDKYTSKTVCLTALAKALAVYPDTMKLLCAIKLNSDMDLSISFQAALAMVLTTKTLDVAVLDGMALSSLMNFMTLNMSCKVWDKNIVYVIPNLINGTFHTTAKAAMDGVCPGGYSDAFSMKAAIQAAITAALIPIRIRAVATSDAVILPDLAGHIELGYRDSYLYSGTGHIRKSRPLPMLALTAFQYAVRVFVEHEGILHMELADDTIHFKDNDVLEITRATGVEQTGRIPFRENSHSMQNFTSASMEESGQNIGVHTDPLNMIAASGRVVEHTAPIPVHGDATVLSRKSVAEKHTGGFAAAEELDIYTVPPNELKHTGRFHSTGQFEMSFANEQSILVQPGRIRVADGNIDLAFQDTKAVEHSGQIDTKETISLQEAPPLEVAAEGSFTTQEQGEMSRDRVLEQSAEAVIRAVASGDVSFGLNAQLIAEMNAARTTEQAVLIVRRLVGLVSEVEVTTKEAALMIPVLRKLLESTNMVSTNANGVLIQCLIRFAESSNNIICSASESEAVARLPKPMFGANAKVATGYGAFLDMCYARGDSFGAEAEVNWAASADMAQIETDHRMQAAEYIRLLYETAMEQIPTTGLEGASIAQTDADAHMVMARSEKIFALVYEEELVTELDGTAADELERHLIFE